MKSIVSVPHTVLTTPAARVVVFDKKLGTLIGEMKETLLSTTKPKGVGLAATQVGVSQRIFLTKPNATSTIRVFINPIITKPSDQKTDGVPERENKLEGCLSIPNVWGKVKRTASLTLHYQDETGQKHEEKFNGFIATIIQHETDHINGILFTQRVLEQRGKLYQTIIEDGKEVLDEIKLI